MRAMSLDLTSLSPGGQMLVEELVDNGIATLMDGMLSIGIDDFYALEPGARAWLAPGNAIEGEVHVRIDGALGKEDAIWHAEVEVDGQTFTAASMVWPYIRMGEDLNMMGLLVKLLFLV